MKQLFIRVDIDSYKGLKEGVPNLLKLFKENKVKATFFLTVGREGNILEYLKYKLLQKNQREINPFPKSILKKARNRKLEILKMLFYPSMLFKENVLKELVNDGHELQIHCFSHIVWRQAKYKNIKIDLKRAQKFYKKAIGKPATGFASPYYSWNTDIAKLVKESNFKYIAIHNNPPKPSVNRETNTLNIPTTIYKSKQYLPICEYYARLGYKGDDLTERALQDFKNQKEKLNFLCTYIHPRVEGIELFDEFSNFIQETSKQCKMDKTFSDLL